MSARRAGRDDGPAAAAADSLSGTGVDYLSTPFLGDRREPIPARPKPRPNSDLFPTVRRGYQREVVDRYARKIQVDLDQLKRRCEVLRTENTELRAAREETVTMSGPADFTGLGHRAQEILRMAEEQARDVTRRAAREADQLAEETQAELDRRRETVNTELDEMRQSQLHELETLRRQAERDVEEVSIRSRTETEQLLAAARMTAEAVKTESEATARSLVESATVEAEAILAAAEKDAGRINQQRPPRSGAGR